MFEFLNSLLRRRALQADPPGMAWAVTDTQAELVDVRDKYRRELMGAVGPVDRVQAQDIVRRMYELAGLQAPAFIWLNTPDQALFAATLIAREKMAVQYTFPSASFVHSVVLGAHIRNALFRLPNQETMAKRDLERLRDLLPSTRDSCRIFRAMISNRTLYQEVVDCRYAIDWWLTKFLDIEEQVACQSSALADQWNKAAQSLWILSERQHLDELQRITEIAEWITQGNGSWWSWNEPPALAGSAEAIHGAVLEGYEFFSKEKAPGLSLMREFILNCGWCLPFESLCIMADRPSEYFKLNDIEIEDNIEVRRLMIEMYGMGRYLADTHAEMVHEDECGQLYRTEQDEDEDLLVVKVINSTIEPDGSRRQYFLRVPPTMRRAREAVAWTFGLEEKEYKPELET